MDTDRKNQPKNVLPELVIPALAFVFTLYYLTTITEVPWIAQASAVTVSTLLLLSIVIFAIRTFIRVRRGTEVISFADTCRDLSNQRKITRSRIVLLLLTIAYLLVLPYAGFTLSTFVFVFAGIVTLSSFANWLPALCLASACSILGYVVFIHLFKTRFPLGPIENLLKGLL